MQIDQDRLIFPFSIEPAHSYQQPKSWPVGGMSWEQQRRRYAFLPLKALRRGKSSVPEFLGILECDLNGHPEVKLRSLLQRWSELDSDNTYHVSETLKGVLDVFGM